MCWVKGGGLGFVSVLYGLTLQLSEVPNVYVPSPIFICGVLRFVQGVLWLDTRFRLGDGMHPGGVSG
jgi:hypothetical protein